MMETVTLNNGRVLPLIGLGTNTFGKVDHNWNGAINFDTKEIESALKAGYRFLDTAVVYRNEEVVGLGVLRSAVKREEVIIQTKLPSVGHYIKDEQTIRSTVEESLNKLSTNYIDVYLMHQPRPSDEENLAIYRVLEKLVDEGKILTLGVSNFSVSQLDYLLKHSRHKPAINQIEIHPGHWNLDLVKFCQENGVLVQAWSPLFRTSEIDKQVIQAIGEKHQKSWAQVVLNYLTSQGIMVITKSHDEGRQRENLDVFDFILTQEEKEKMASLKTSHSLRLGILGGTGFIGKTLSSEAIRIGYEVVNLSLDGKILPQRHLLILTHDFFEVDSVIEKFKDVDVLISTLHDVVGEKYYTLHKNAILLAKKINKPLVVVGTYASLWLEDSKTTIFATLDEQKRQEESLRIKVLEDLKAETNLNWTYISPSIEILKNGVPSPYNVGGSFQLRNGQGKREIGLIDLVDFILAISNNQQSFNQQHLTIANR